MTDHSHTADFAILGAGLAGSLMAMYLAKNGYTVDAYEKRPDPLSDQAEPGKSINLALSARGIHALNEVGLADKVLSHGLPMRGRMMHSETAGLSYLAYGTKDEALFSVSRAKLNITLIEAAQGHDGVRFHFDHECTAVDFQNSQARFLDKKNNVTASINYRALLGADGAFSVLRSELERNTRFNYQQYFLDHGYKELTIPATSTDEFAMSPDALHIWPRGNFMLIALPNEDRSFTCTLFAPFEGKVSFRALQRPEHVDAFFKSTFPDAMALMPGLTTDYFNNPTGALVTVRCYPWAHNDNTVLLGDAAHAVVPFFGQGINAGFEDCAELLRCIMAHPDNLKQAFTTYQHARKANTDTLAQLSLDNYIEMRDDVNSWGFLMRARFDNVLHKLMPQTFHSLHGIVSFTRIPYAVALKRIRRQHKFTRALLVLMILLLLAFIVF
jgi:kynurenine 3-monooxygenase